MRFHTTLKDIAVSVIVLLSCAVLCFYGMVHLGMGNPSQYLATYLLAALDRGGTYTLATDTVQRTYLKDLVLVNPQISNSEDTLISAEEMRISGGIPSLLGSVLFGQKDLEISFTDPSVNLDTQKLGASQTNGNDHHFVRLPQQWV